jgi:hypothetical protein
MIIHKKVTHRKKYVQGRGFIPVAAKNAESAGKTIRPADSRSLANAKKAASEIKNSTILNLLEDIKKVHVGKGFKVI